MRMAAPTAQVKGSILHDIKQMLGQEWDDTTYDLDITNHINTVFFNLSQIGVGPEDGFSIEGPDEKWVEYVGERKNFQAVKTYIYLRVRMVFDPPATGPMMQSLQAQADKLEWTLSVEADRPYTPPTPPTEEVFPVFFTG